MLTGRLRSSLLEGEVILPSLDIWPTDYKDEDNNFESSLVRAEAEAA